MVLLYNTKPHRGNKSKLKDRHVFVHLYIECTVQTKSIIYFKLTFQYNSKQINKSHLNYVSD
jgi:hypothetical protein